MEKSKKDKDFVYKPFYPGGKQALDDFIKHNLQYPKKAINNKVQGTVHLKYIIDYKGNVKEVKVISGIGSGCDEEAVRLVKMLKFRVEKNHKTRVQFNRKIQIHFRLPKQAPEKNLIQYQLVESKSNRSYQYSITLGNNVSF